MLIDLRSDTVTRPTPEMRRAMAEAEVGDDVYGDDPSVNRLQELAAEKVGKEAALFLPSGTMGNQVAVMTHARRGEEVILEAEAHIFYYEVGGLAVLAGVQTRPLPGKRGVITPAQVRGAIRGDDIHFPRTGLVCLENTHNRVGGAVWPLEEFREVCGAAHEAGVPVHLDGARVFNAAIYYGLPVTEITQHVDSVMFCLSKGLCAPVGSILAGDRDFIARARKHRKLLGGGMRQAGVLAAAGIVALEKMVDRLAEDHDNARRLAAGLAEMRRVRLDLDAVQTNIVYFDVDGDAYQMVEELSSRGVLVNSTGPARIRVVTHHDVSREDIGRALEIMKEVLD